VCITLYIQRSLNAPCYSCQSPDPDFPGQSRFLTTCPEKITVLPGLPFVPFWAWCPGYVSICPSLQPYAYASVAKNQLRFYLYVRKKSLAAGAPPRTLLGSSRRSPRPPSRTPTAGACAARALRFAPLALVPDCGARIMATLCLFGHEKRQKTPKNAPICRYLVN